MITHLFVPETTNNDNYTQFAGFNGSHALFATVVGMAKLSTTGAVKQFP